MPNPEVPIEVYFETSEINFRDKI